MPPRRIKSRKVRAPKTSGAWTQNTGSGFYPTNIAGHVTSMMSPYMQAALGVGSSNMFGTNMGNRRADYGYDYQNQQLQNPYFRVSNRKFNNRGTRGRNSGRARRNNNNNNNNNKRPNAQGGMSRGGSKRQRKAYRQADEEENDDDAGYEESGRNQSSELRTKQHSKEWKNANDSQTRYCTVCEVDFVGSFFNHRRNVDHRRNKDKKYPRCRLCRMTFSGVEEYEAHNETEEHKKMNEDFQVLKQQQIVHADLSDSEGEQTSIEKYIGNQESEIISDESAEPVGIFHLVPMKVYFCKLCQKLFPNYMHGRHVHCRTPAHIQAYKVYFDGKEERAAERSKLKQEKKKEKAARKAQSRLEKSEGGEGADVSEEMNSEDDSDEEYEQENQEQGEEHPEDEEKLTEADQKEDDQLEQEDENKEGQEQELEDETYNQAEHPDDTGNGDAETGQEYHSDVSA